MRRRIGYLGALAAIAALAIGLRVTQTYATSWAGDQLVPYDTDTYYQLRRVELWRAGDFPPGVQDGFVNAPARFDCPWPLGLPLLLDGIIRVVTIGRGASAADIASISAWAIPVLAALTPLLLIFLLWKRGPGIAFMGGIAAAAIPPMRMAGHFARIDHHVLEPTAAIAFALLILRAPAARRVPRFVATALLGAACAFTLDLTFVICAGFAGVGVLYAILKRPLEVDEASVVGLGVGIALATLGDLALGAPRALPADLRLGIAGAFVASLLLARFRWRWLWVLLGLSIALSLARGLALGVWLTAPRDSVTLTMEETRSPWAEISLPQAAFHLVPLVLGIIALARDLPLLLLFGALALLNVAQLKYQALGALLQCCGWAFVPALLARAIPARMSLLRNLLSPAVAVFVVAVSMALMPPNPPLRQIPIAQDLANLAKLVPQIRDPNYDPPRATPQSITLAHPVDGVRFDYLAHVAVPSLPFWGQATSLAQYEETIELLKHPNSPAVEKKLDAWRVKYVLTTSPRPALGLYEQLRVALGTDHPGWPSTATLRLVAESGSAKLFQRVKGVTIRGRATPGEKVSVEAGARTRERVQGFAVAAKADDQGNFTLTFPYASDSAWPVHVTVIRLRCAGAVQTLQISNDAVERGEPQTADCLK